MERLLYSYRTFYLKGLSGTGIHSTTRGAQNPKGRKFTVFVVMPDSSIRLPVSSSVFGCYYYFDSEVFPEIFVTDDDDSNKRLEYSR